MRNITRIEDFVGSDGFIDHGYSFWVCDCGSEVRRYRGQSDVDCPNCSASFNASGQRLIDNWRDNPSNYDDEIGDMEGYEIACLRRENETGQW